MAKKTHEVRITELEKLLKAVRKERENDFGEIMRIDQCLTDSEFAIIEASSLGDKALNELKIRLEAAQRDIASLRHNAQGDNAAHAAGIYELQNRKWYKFWSSKNVK